MAENLFSDYPDRVATLKKYMKIEELVMPLEEAFGEKDFFKTPQEGLEFYQGALEEIGKFCAKEVRPTAAQIDEQGCTYKDGVVTLPEALLSHMRRCSELGVFSGPIARTFGGLNLPRLVQMQTLEMMGHACPNTALTLAAFSMADFLQHFGTPEQIETYMPKLMTNEWTTSMALTEPGAGSDLGAMRSSARKDGDHWVINGTKHFITNGDGHVCFALVRTDPKSTGLQGLSVLIVPHHIDGKENFRVSKIEHKVCLHASPTCELVYENSIGYLLGPEGQGFKVMAELMNTARLAMGALSTGIAHACYDAAKDYAKTRTTMGKPIIQHPMVADMLHEMDIEIRAMRALVAEASMAYDWMQIAKKKGDDKEFKRWRLRYRRLTPLVKYQCSEKAIKIAKDALQIFGGYGVCKEYPVERLLRETLIYPIYEGTSQIQSLMVLKDTLKDVSSQATGFLGSLAGAWAEAKVARNPIKGKVLQARNELNQGIKTILGSIIRGKFTSDIESLKEKNIQQFLKDFSLQLLSAKTDLTFPFLCAERFTRITCDYYALKCLADRCPENDSERQKWVLEFANLAIPRMQLENHYMLNRLPSTLEYMKDLAKD